MTKNEKASLSRRVHSKLRILADTLERARGRLEAPETGIGWGYVDKQCEIAQGALHDLTRDVQTLLGEPEPG
jgi:hypothetical protein